MMEAQLKSPDKILRSEWDALVQRSPMGNLYGLTYFMDAVCPNWQGIEVLENKELVAVMPLQIRSKMGFQYSLQPPFVQHWGIFWEQRIFQSTYHEFRWKKQVMEKIIACLPPSIKLYAFNCGPEMDYGLPFHWEGFSLKTRYTYRLDLREGSEAVFAGIKRKRRNQLRQAEKRYGKLEPKRDPKGLIELIEKNRAAGKPIMPKAYENAVAKIVHAMREEGFVLEARQDTGELHAAAYAVRCANKTTFLISAKDPLSKQEDASAYVLWEAIRHASTHSEIFDFEGSMMKGIESFFRAFGGRPVPYLNIEKNDLPLWVRWIKKLR